MRRYLPCCQLTRHAHLVRWGTVLARVLLVLLCLHRSQGEKMEMGSPLPSNAFTRCRSHMPTCPHATRPQHWVENLLLSFHNDLVSRNEDEFDEDRDGVVVMVLWTFHDVLLSLRPTVGVSGEMRAEALMSLPVTNGTTYSIRNENCPDPGADFSNGSFVPRIKVRSSQTI